MSIHCCDKYKFELISQMSFLSFFLMSFLFFINFIIIYIFYSGWCGNLRGVKWGHCDCKTCIDYSKVYSNAPDEKQYLPKHNPQNGKQLSNLPRFRCVIAHACLRRECIRSCYVYFLGFISKIHTEILGILHAFNYYCCYLKMPQVKEKLIETINITNCTYSGVMVDAVRDFQPPVLPTLVNVIQVQVSHRRVFSSFVIFSRYNRMKQSQNFFWIVILYDTAILSIILYFCCEFLFWIVTCK